MKCTLITSLFIVGLCMLSCDSSNEEPGPTELATISLEPGFLEFNVQKLDETWFVVWDDNGKVLDYKKVTPGEDVKLTTTETIITDKISLGYFSFVDAKTDYHYIQVFTDLDPGFTFKRSKPAALEPADGTFKVHITNGPDIFDGYFRVSTKVGNASRSTIVPGVQGDYLVYRIKGVDRYLINYEGITNKYALLENVKTGDEFTFDFSELGAYENPVKINMPDYYGSYYGQLYGFEEGQSFSDRGYQLDFVSPGDYLASGNFESGYFPGIKKFSTKISAIDIGVSSYFTKQGDLPGTIEWPNTSKYFVNSSDPTAPSFSVSGSPVQYITASWDKMDGDQYAYLIIYSPKLAPKVGEVPVEMITAHARFEIKKEYYQSLYADFIVNNTKTYLKEVQNMFTQAPDNDENEKMEISVQTTVN